MNNSALLKDQLFLELKHLYSLGDKVKTANDIGPLMRAMTNVSGLSFFSTGVLVEKAEDHASIMIDFLSSVEPERLNILGQITVLRSSLSYKNLPVWKSLRDKIYQEVKKQNDNPERIMIGLLD